MTATGLANMNLSALTTVTYLNRVTKAVLTSPPTQAGMYDVLVSFAGNSRYNAVPLSDSHQVVTINTVVPTVVFNSVNFSVDGSPHEPSFSATGALGENLNSLVLVQYVNTANGTTTVTPPTSAGTYEVDASFLGNPNYRYIQSYDTGKTVTLTNAPTRSPRIGDSVLAENFLHSGGPYGGTLYSNGTPITGNLADVADLPGSTYNYFTTNGSFPGGTIATGVGSSGASATMGPQSNLVGSLQNAAGYREPSILTLSVDLEMNTIAGNDFQSRGIGLGLNATVPTGFNAGNPINNGIIVNAATGNLYFTGSNGGSITLVPGGSYNAGASAHSAPTSSTRSHLTSIRPTAR